jgi:biliverdin reductase / flavin reductase
VLNQDDVDKTVQGTDAVIIVLGTRNSTAPTTMMSEGTKNVMQAMKKNGLKKFSACMSSFLFMQPEMVPKVFIDLNADHKRMLEAIKESDLDYRAVLPPHIASQLIKIITTIIIMTIKIIFSILDEPSAPFQILYDKSPGRSISKFDLGKFFVDCLEQEEHARKVIGIATIK